MIPYFKMFADVSETINLLSDAEAGRLFKALGNYLNDREVNLPGQEKLVFGMLKAQIDRDFSELQSYRERQTKNGTKGGRPKTQGNPKKSGFSAKNPKNLEIDIDTDIETDTDTEIDTDNHHPSDDSACEDEFENPYGDKGGDRPRFDTVQAYANNNLNALGVRAMEELNDFVETTSEEVVRHAIDNALDNGVRSWAYVRAILNKYEDAGIKTAGDAKDFDDKRKHPDDATVKPTQEDDDLRPRPVMPNPADVDRIYDDNHLVIGWKILRTGETMMLSDYSKMTFGEQERFWDSKHIRWTNELFWRT